MSKARRQELVDELHGVELRATSARVAVLDAVRQSDAPVTHAELTQRLSGRGFDAATIYRNLMAITEAGLIQRKDHGDRRWRFESAGPGDVESAHSHPHFLCTDCGAVSCLPEVEIKLPPARGLPRSTHVGAFEVQLRGVCDSCADA
ncbi:MAG: transcriptional repressor [Acidimicrobiales bacterium]|nr:transcriptional repressor [Acidimicrobiales bacterium]